MTEELDRIRVRAYGRPPGQSISVPKVEMPTLPAKFTETVLGTPLWIAHPGSIGQYRAPPALHAYELDDHWKVHRDRYEPEEDPLGHLLFDAPEIAIAGAAAVFAGISMFCWLDEREREIANKALLASFSAFWLAFCGLIMTIYFIKGWDATLTMPVWVLLETLMWSTSLVLAVQAVTTIKLYR